MISEKQLSRLSGLLLLLILVTSFVAAGLASGVGEYHVAPEQAPDVLQRVAENKGLHVAEIGVDFVSWVLTVALGVVLYLTFRAYSRLLALLGTLGHLAGGLILAMHDIPNFVLTSLADRFVAASGTEAIALQTAGSVVLATASWGLSVGITFLGLGILFYGILTVRSKVVPPILGWLGIIAGALITVGVWFPRYDAALNFVFVILASPVGLWQLSLGLWLILRRKEVASSVDPRWAAGYGS